MAMVIWAIGCDAIQPSIDDGAITDGSDNKIRMT